jgi:hypothetical protein
MENPLKMTLLLVALLLVQPSLRGGQSRDVCQPQASTPPSDARFEIFQAAAAANWTFKLDRVTGNVERLVPSKSGNPVWERMRVLPHPKAANAIKPHFQIVVSDSAAQSVLLLDTESGATWQLVRTKNGGLWQPIQ